MNRVFISFDFDVFLPIVTCCRDSMDIIDISFCPFEMVSEPNTTTTLSQAMSNSFLLIYLLLIFI
jgi:hypothetical protein